MPNKSTNSKQLEDFLNYLHAPTTSPAEPQHPRKLSVIEGVAREVRRMLSGRNKRIRDAAFKGANGVCEACGNDYSKVLAGSGTRVLHVHHKKQLSLQILPDETTLDDLAVVCANCHMLIHMDPQNAIPVEVLSGMLIEDQAPKYGTKAS